MTLTITAPLVVTDFLARQAIVFKIQFMSLAVEWKVYFNVQHLYIDKDCSIQIWVLHYGDEFVP